MFFFPIPQKGQTLRKTCVDSCIGSIGLVHFYQEDNETIPQPESLDEWTGDGSLHNQEKQESLRTQILVPFVATPFYLYARPDNI